MILIFGDKGRVSFAFLIVMYTEYTDYAGNHIMDSYIILSRDPVQICEVRRLAIEISSLLILFRP